MIERLQNRFFVPRHNYPDPLDAQRAQSLIVFLLFSGVFSAIIGILALIARLVSQQPLQPLSILGIVVPIVTIILYEMVNRGLYHIAILILLGFSFTIPIVALQQDVHNPQAIALALPIAIAGTLRGWRSLLATTAIVLIILAYFVFFAPLAEGVERQPQIFIGISAIIFLIAILLLLFGTSIQFSAQRLIGDLRSLRDTSAALDFGSLDTNEQNLSAEAIDLIRDKLGYTYAQVFLVDETRYIQQRISSGLNIAQINVDTEVILNENSGILEAIQDNKFILLDNRSSEARRSHLLPGINTAVALPIRDNDALIGILDVQSEVSANFTPQAIDTLNIIANQLGLAIAEARVVNELRGNLDEQNNLIQRQRNRLLEFERAERRATAASWAKYLEQRGIEYLGFDVDALKDDEPIAGFDVTDDLRQALESGEISIRQEGDYQVLLAPIMLRGFVLGAMSFKIPVGRQMVGQRQIDLVRSVVQRLALALENKRLFEQSQAQAQRESKANEVGNLLLSTTDIETVLKLAVENFAESLGAIQTQIHIQPEVQQSAEELS